MKISEIISEAQQQLDEACWKGYRKDGMKTMFGKKYPNCVKVKKKTNEAHVDEMIGFTQGQPATTRPTAKPASRPSPNYNKTADDKRSQLQKSKDSGNKNWYKISETGAVDEVQLIRQGEKTHDGIGLPQIRLLAGEGKLTNKTVLQAIAIIRKQREKQGVAEAELNEAKRKKRKAKSKRRTSSTNRSPVPLFYGAWGFGGEGDGGDGGE